MRRWILMVGAALLLLSQGALAAPTYEGTDQNPGQKPPALLWHRITLDTSTTQSRNFALGQSCSVKFTKVGSGNVVLYEVPTSSAAYTSGVAETTFTASTTEAYTFKPGAPYGTVRAASDSDGSIVEISCLNDGTFSGGSGGGVLAFESICADPANVSSYPCIDQNGLTWYRNAEALEVPYPVGPTHTRSMQVDTAGVMLGTDAVLGIADTWTFTAWTKLISLPATGVRQRILFLRNTTGPNNSAAILSWKGAAADGGSVDVHAEIYNSTGTKIKDIEWEVQVPDASEWHQITITHDGGSTGDPTTLYFDGGEFPVQYHLSSGYTNNTGTMDDPTTRSARLFGNDGSTQGLNGYWHSAALGDFVMTAEQAAQLYNAGASANYLYFGFDHVWRACEPGVIDTQAQEDRGDTDAVRDATASGSTACINSNPGRPTVPIRGRTHVTGYGDSRMWLNLGENASEGFLPLIGKDFVTENRGVGGDLCDDVAVDVAADAATLDTDVVVIQCGVNDALPANYTDAAEVHDDIQGMVDDLVAQDIRVIVMTPFPVLDSYVDDAERQPNTDEIAQYFRDHPFTGAEICDTHQLWNTEVGDDSAKQAFYDDGIHVTHKEGDELIGGWLYDCLGTPLPF